MPTQPRISLPLAPIPDARFEFAGLIGERLAANIDQWLLVAPQANPAMLEMFRDRDALPRRDLLPWSGEFAGKYLTSAVLAWRIAPDARLRATIERFVDELIGVQAVDGYFGPHPQSERLTGRTFDGKYALWDLWGPLSRHAGFAAVASGGGVQPRVGCLPARRRPHLRPLSGHRRTGNQRRR